MSMCARALLALLACVRAEDYTVEFAVQLTSERRETFLVTVREAKAPIAAQRFRELVNSGFFAGCRFFRVSPGRDAFFGISGNTTLQRHWDKLLLQEERTIEHKDWNMRGTIAFATKAAGGSSSVRGTELLINYDDNHQFDSAGVIPFGRVVKGMKVVDSVYSGYRERPLADMIRQRGEEYLRTEFPRLSYVYGAQQVAFVEEPFVLSKNMQGALITARAPGRPPPAARRHPNCVRPSPVARQLGMVLFAALACAGIRVLSRTKGYSKTPRAAPSFDDYEEEGEGDGDDDDDDHGPSAALKRNP